MKKALFSILTAVSAMAALSGPAAAQPYGGPGPNGQAYGGQPQGPGGYRPDGGRHDEGYRDGDHRDGDARGGPVAGGWDVDRRIQWTQDRIARGRADGSLDRREFRRIQGQLGSIRAQENDFRRRAGGRLYGRPLEIIAGRLDHLNAEIHWLRRNDERRPWQ